MAEAAGERLGNTPAIARSSYIHPDVIDLSETALDPDALAKVDVPRGLRSAEARLLTFLRSSRD
jgi:DNA topoisomerase-1